MVCHVYWQEKGGIHLERIGVCLGNSGEGVGVVSALYLAAEAVCVCEDDRLALLSTS